MTLPEIKTVAISDHDLAGTVVMACSVGALEETVEEIRALLRCHRHIAGELFQILKAFSDLYLELTDKAAERKWLDARIKAAEREAARLRLPIWFWRRDPDAGVRHMLKARAAWMIEEHYLDDDTFDLLKEYLEHIGEERVTDRQIVGLIESVRGEMCRADTA